MSFFTSKEFCQQKLHIEPEGMLALLDPNPGLFVFIKNNLSAYQYANPSFLELMGLKTLNNIVQRTDYDLSRDPQKIKTYIEHDTEVLETGRSLSLCEDVLPKKNAILTKRMKGCLYPVFADNQSRPLAVLGVVKACYLPFKLTLETALSLSADELSRSFIRRSYPVKVHNQKICLSRRELQCLIEMMKGRHAGEIATVLQIKQTTVEFYLNNLKNKLGATGRSSLIMTVLDQKIIQQVIL